MADFFKGGGVGGIKQSDKNPVFCLNLTKLSLNLIQGLSPETALFAAHDKH